MTGRSLLLVGWLAIAAVPPALALDEEAVARAVAVQEIETLRRLYARATDLIGLGTPEAVAEGRAIYRRIFAPDARITAGDDGRIDFSATGPDAWAEVVEQVLGQFAHTQHLIGTQLVLELSLPDDRGRGGEGVMESYLQAWHQDPGRVLDIFIGTYRDRVRYFPGMGWRIVEMHLERVGGSVTSLAEAP